MMKIAILLTCHNRREKTVKCLKSLYTAIERSVSSGKFDIYVVDDGSTDGTSDLITDHFPEINLIKGTGNLYWAGGMRLAWQTALNNNQEYDFFLLLNDDTFLFRDSIEIILGNCLKYSREKNCHAIFVGTTTERETGELTYGGRKLYSAHRPTGNLVQSDSQWVECDLGNANIMLVSKTIVEKIGILSANYTHSIADYDYTLRAQKAGFKIMVAPGILGNCTFDHGKNWKSNKTRLPERIKYLYSPKGLAYKEYVYFIKKHFPSHLPEAIFKLWLKTLFPFFYDWFK